jgi:cell division protein FtsZ
MSNFALKLKNKCKPQNNVARAGGKNMTLNLTMAGHEELKPRITVFGVGGAGGNAVDNMIDKSLEGVEFVVANTDAQALQQSGAPSKIQLGVKATEGLGAGAQAAVGAAAAEESIEQIIDNLAGAHMCFITAGMGGGTGTGAAPIIAQAARELGVLTVGVVTKPFQFEGSKRMRQAEEGVEALQQVVDTLIIIPNQNLFRVANEKTTFTDAFSMADDVLYQGVKGVTDLMVRPGLINLDFADVRAVMDEMGKAMMGTGEATGEDRAVQAADKAVSNPLLDEISLRGAKGVLINITGGVDLTLFELDEAANRIREEVDPDANIIVGSTLDTTLEGVMRVSVVATGIDAGQARSFRIPPIKTEVVTPKFEQSAGENENFKLPELTFDENESFVSNDLELTPEAAILKDDAAEMGDLAQVDSVEVSVEEGTDVEHGISYVGLSEPGTPSPEAMARLRAAVEKVPLETTINKSVETPVVEVAERPRFGLNSLINRMTGHHETVDRGEVSPPSTVIDQEFETEKFANERIDIPAFLRRQAN